MTQRSRRLLLLATVAGLAALVVGGWLLWPRSAISRENAARIREGMTLAEVQEILGGPARNETAGRAFPFYAHASFGITAADDGNEQWIGPECAVWIGFQDGRVAAFAVGSSEWKRETAIEKARRWLRL